MARELVRLGLLRQNPERFNTLSITEEGLTALRERRSVTLSRPMTRRPDDAAGRRGAAIAGGERLAAGSPGERRGGVGRKRGGKRLGGRGSDIACDEDLFEKLRSLRKRNGLTLDELSAHRVGALIALYERAVGFYAGLVGINAYHQPGVEAGKRAAQGVIALQGRVQAALAAAIGRHLSVEELASAAGAGDRIEEVFHILEHLAANPDRGVLRMPGATPFDARYAAAPR